MNEQGFQLKQPAEFFFRHPCVAHDAGHCERVDRIVPRDGENTNAVRHNDVLSLARDAETCFLKSANSSEVIDSGESGHASTNLDFANVCITHKIIANQQIFLYRFANIVESLSFRSTL